MKGNSSNVKGIMNNAKWINSYSLKGNNINMKIINISVKGNKSVKKNVKGNSNSSEGKHQQCEMVMMMWKELTITMWKELVGMTQRETKKHQQTPMWRVKGNEWQRKTNTRKPINNGV